MADNIRPFRGRAPEPTAEEERQLQRQVRKHRIQSRAAVLVFLLAALLLIVYFYIDYQRKEYSGCEILEWNELSGMENSQSRVFGDNLLRYNKDGAAYITYGNEQIWNQPYEMQEPILDVGTEAAAIADWNGNDIYIFGKDGLKGEIKTLLPIQKIAVSDAFTIAVLLKDGDVSRIHYYNSSGELISEMRIGMDNMGYPMAMDLSPNGNLFMLSFLSVSGGSMNSVISFYNFGNVGQEYNDRLVKAKTYEDTVFPVVKFLDDSTSAAYGDNLTQLFSGSQIPEEGEAISFDCEIKSVFSDRKYLGFILEGKEGEASYLLEVYDRKGSLLFSSPVDFSYSGAKIDREKVILFNDTECAIYSMNGVRKYQGEPGMTIRDIISTNKQSGYLVVTPTELNRIKLK